MSLPALNIFEGELRNSSAAGVALTPGNNTYPAPVEVFGSATTVAWPTSTPADDAFELEVNINGVAVSAASKNLKVTLYWRLAASGVDVADNEIDNTTPHGLVTGDGPWTFTTTGTDPTGIVAGTEYWPIRRSSTAFALATSEANARAGTAIDITGTGTGTLTWTCEKIRKLDGSEAGALASASAGGATYRKPLHIPAGVLIYASASVNNATVGSVNVLLRLMTEPSKPWAIRTGTFVRTFGEVGASAGTPITPSNGSKSAYVDLGPTSDDLWHWNVGFGFDNAAFPNNNLQLVDLAVGETGTERLAIRDVIVFPSNGEQLGAPVFRRDGPLESVAGENVFVRMQSNGVAGTGWSVLGYGVGGRYDLAGSYEVAGAVTVDDDPAADGKTITIYAVDSDGIVDLVTTTATAGGAGEFSVLVPDDTRSYFASYEDGADVGRSASGTPGVSTFDIAIGGSGVAPVVLTNNATTAELLRDHIIALMAALTPRVHAREKFIPYRNEGGADFQRWAEGLEAGAAFRRFQVRDTGAVPSPDVSNTDVEARFVRFEILIAYPQNSRMGKKAALDRDDAANVDQHQIEQTVGLNGYANFTGASVPNAAWVEGGPQERIIGEGVDFVRITQLMRFYRRMIP